MSTRTRQYPDRDDSLSASSAPSGGTNRAVRTVAARIEAMVHASGEFIDRALSGNPQQFLSSGQQTDGQ